VGVSFKSRLIKILQMLVERPQAFNKPMEKAERMWGAKEDVLWGYPGKNLNANLTLGLRLVDELKSSRSGRRPSHGMREG